MLKSIYVSIRRSLWLLSLGNWMRLKWRRSTRQARVSDIALSVAAICRRYRTMATPVAMATLDEAMWPSLIALRQIHVLARPPTIIASDWTLLWPFAPQLRRRPLTCDALWRRPQAARALAGTTFFAAVDGFSYYHWLTGVVPKLLVANFAPATFDHVLVNQRHKGKKNFQIELLEYLKVPLAKVIWLERGVHLLCENLVLPSEPCRDHQTFLEPWAFALLRQNLLPWAAATTVATASLPKKIFVSRKNARHRRLENEDQIAATLIGYGYQTVLLESYPVATQIQLFAQAESIIALHGAGLSHLVFCKPGTQVIEMLPDGCDNPCFQRLATLARLRYRAVAVKSCGAKNNLTANVWAEDRDLLDRLT